jgi:putative intracellular protease/amidase
MKIAFVLYDQFTALDLVGPYEVIRATVRQTVRTLNGAVLTEGVVLHTYVFRGGLIARMDISEPGP